MLKKKESQIQTEIRVIFMPNAVFSTKKQDLAKQEARKTQGYLF